MLQSRVDHIAEPSEPACQVPFRADPEQIREILGEILASEQFRTSHRSRAFLEHVVEKAIHGNSDELKERILGVELFGRDPLFDTDRDSIVRVAANDVRKRLREYYRGRPQGGIRIALPSGCYIPKIEIEPGAPPADIPAPPCDSNRGRGHSRQIVLIALVTCSVAVAGYLGVHRGDMRTPGLGNLPPWSALLQSGEPVNVVLADANLVFTQAKLRHLVSIGAYANHRFDYATTIPDLFSGPLNNLPMTSVSDAILARRVAKLAASSGVDVRLRYCNRLQMSELKSSEPLVFFGSPMSDPWVALFYDQMNFRVVHRFDSGMDVCMNRRPKPGEPSVYVPKQNHQGFSEAYALIALEPNLNGTAPVLIIAGTSSEGTQAAGEFVTNPERLSETLAKFGIDLHSRYQHLELVIKTAYVSASSARSEVIACRVQR